MTDTLGAHLAKLKQETNGNAPPAETEQSTDLVPAPPPRPAEMTPADFAVTPPKVVGALPYVSTYMRLAKTICGTELVPGPLRDRPDAILAAMMMGYELGLGPMQALNGIQVIDGKAGLSPELMRALVQQSGHTFILSQGNDSAKVRCRRMEWPEGEWSEFTWTMDDARRANLIKANTTRSGWAKYPRAMLAARVSSEACRAIFSDVLSGMSYTPEEIRDFDDSPAPAPAPQPETVTVTQPPVVEQVVAESEAAMEALAEPVVDPPPAPAKRAAKKAAAAATAPGEADVRRELLKGLSEVIKSLPSGQAPLVRAFLARHGMGDLPALTQDQILQATNLAAGWPTSATAWEASSAGTDTTGGDGGDPPVVDAEVDEEGLWRVFDETRGLYEGEELF